MEIFFVGEGLQQPQALLCCHALQAFKNNIKKMSLVSSSIIIRTVSFLHITAGYYLLSKPSLLTDQNLVLILSEAMQLPSPSDTSSALSEPNTATAIAGLFLAMLGFTDMLGCAVTEFAYDEFWSAQVPVRVAMWLGLTGWVYVTARGKDVEKHASTNAMKEAMGMKVEWTVYLQNGLIFTIAFVEASIWFWVWLTLRDERKRRAEDMVEKKRREKEDML